MAWNRLVQTVLGSHATARPAEDEIDEELLFHLRSLVDDNLAAGMNADDAWCAARKRFGSLRQYSDACRRSPLAGLWPGLAAGLLAAGLLGLWVVVEVQSLRRDQLAALRAMEANVETLVEVRNLSVATARQLAEATAASATNGEVKRSDLAGTILDHQGRPIDDAEVLVILKTWPGGRYRQQAFSTTTGGDGRFRLPELVPVDGQIAFLVAALKDGHALTSIYQLREAGQSVETEQVTLRLEDAPTISLVVRDENGRPVANAEVLPSGRQSQDGENHLVYFQGSESLSLTADAAGRVDLSCFERGDEAEIYVRLPGDDWKRQSIQIPNDGDVVTVSAGKAVAGG